LRFKASEIATLSVAALAFAGSIISALYTYLNHNREMDIELVKIGVSILRADPNETQTNGAREWAIGIIEDYSKRPFSPDAKRELLEYRLGYNAGSLYDECHTDSGGNITCYKTTVVPITPQSK
jgi:hypothetical protein